MFRSRPKTAYLLSAIIATLTLVASAGGLFIDDLYQGNAFARSAWQGTDVVTLTLAAPTLIVSLALAMRGSRRAQLVWLGMLDYTLYNYAYYLFGTSFNRFFLLYVAIFTLSILALIYALVEIDLSGVRASFGAKRSVKWIAAYMLFVALAIGGLWIAQSLNYVFTGQLPEFLAMVDQHTSVVFALDLSLVVPFMALGGIWLWQRKPWGYTLAAIMNVKGAVYLLALASASLSGVRAGFSEASFEIVLWGVLAIIYLLADVALLSDVQEGRRSVRRRARVT